jgi:uncharacterized Zn-binding protein involved in type VI secretion
MIDVVNLLDVAASREHLGTPGHEVCRTWFLKPPAVDRLQDRLPQAFLVEYTPGCVLRTHFHDVDEFQVVVAGGGTFGGHTVAPSLVHFARAFTPYGPIVAGPAGLSFLTLRAQRDSHGPQKLPEMREALFQVPDRRPFQVSQAATFVESRDGAVITPLDKFKDHGLAAWALGVPDEATLLVPNRDRAAGCYVAVVSGTVTIDGRTLAAPGIAFIPATDAPPAVRAIDGAAQLLVLSFPSTHDDAALDDDLAPA